METSAILVPGPETNPTRPPKLPAYFVRLYAAEKASDCVKCELSDRTLTVTVSECPGVKYIRESGNDPTKWYIECTRTVNQVIADMCRLEFELLFYEEFSGAAQYRFVI